jgi:hypothetical protein
MQFLPVRSKPARGPEAPLWGLLDPGPPGLFSVGARLGCMSGAGQPHHPALAARGYPRVRPGPPLTAAAASRASRSITRRTCAGSHIPRPVAVGTQRLLSAVAMPYHDVTPLRRSSATMGANCDARASARAMRTLRPASPVLDFPVTAMASRGRQNPRGGGSVEGKLAKWRAVSTNFRLRADATATCRRTWYCRILRADGCFRSGAIPTVEPGD